jgi:hypothetical protein
MATDQQGQRGPGSNQQDDKVHIKAGNVDIDLSVDQGNQDDNNRGAASGGSQQGGPRATARNNQGGSDSTDNRGKVLHPETDGRLKGNESHRPNDPDRSAQAEGGRRGGQNSHQGDNARNNQGDDQGGNNQGGNNSNR